MNEQDIINKLTEMGGRLWEKGEMRRIYFDASIITIAGGLSINRYGTGNISSASINGEGISNSEAKRINADFFNAKIWYDLKDGLFHVKNLGESTSSSRAFVNDFIRTAEQAIK